MREKHIPYDLIKSISRLSQTQDVVLLLGIGISLNMVIYLVFLICDTLEEHSQSWKTVTKSFAYFGALFFWESLEIKDKSDFALSAYI